MLTKLILSALALAILTGCSSEAPPSTPRNSEANLTAAASKLQTNPNTSSDVRSIAGGVLQQVKNDHDAQDFAEGK